MPYVYSCRCVDGDKEFKLAFNHVLGSDAVWHKILRFQRICNNTKSMEELKVPFHCIITAPTNCGKTKYLIEQLRGPLKNVFDYIILICPTYDRNKTYHGFAKNDKNFLVLTPDASILKKNPLLNSQSEASIFCRCGIINAICLLKQFRTNLTRIFTFIVEAHPVAFTVNTKIFLYTVFTNPLSVAVYTDISSFIVLANAFSTSSLCGTLFA